MDAKAHQLKTIFGHERRHEVPLYQRPYVWDREKQWVPLWEDMRYLADRVVDRQSLHPHFMGAIVMEQQPVEYGRTETWLIIDGQQRLTTLQIVFAALRDVSAKLQGSEHPHTKALGRLTRNEDLIQHKDDRFKVWPTNVDRDDFVRVLTVGNTEAVRSWLSEARQVEKEVDAQRKHRVPEAYLFFADTAEEWIRAEDGGVERRTSALLDVLRQCIHVVVIELAQQDDAQVIFETLNARGTPLLPADLVKSFLLREAERAGGDIEELYRHYWKRFDDEANEWRSDVLQGRQQRPRIDLFLQHYLVLKTRDEVPVTRVYDQFREWVAASPKVAPAEHLAQLASYSDVYAGFEKQDRSSFEGRFFERLQAMDMSTPLPFLMELFRRVGGPVHKAWRRQVLADIESFMVRRLVCRLNTRGYNKLFLDLLNLIGDDPGASAAAVRAELLRSEADSSRWPGDEEFSAAFLTMPAYKALARSRTRMILEGLEEAKATELSEAVQLPRGLSIEHILPQQWQEWWPIEDDNVEDRALEREGLVHTLGNLTLITGRLNSAMSNGAWDVKRNALQTHSVLSLNSEVVSKGDWSEERIRQRGKAMLARALNVWPRASVAAAPSLI